LLGLIKNDLLKNKTVMRQSIRKFGNVNKGKFKLPISQSKYKHSYLNPKLVPEMVSTKRGYTFIRLMNKQKDNRTELFSPEKLTGEEIDLIEMWTRDNTLFKVAYDVTSEFTTNREKMALLKSIFPYKFRDWFDLNSPHDTFGQFLNLLFKNDDVISAYETYLRKFTASKPRDIDRKVFLAVQEILLRFKRKFDDMFNSFKPDYKEGYVYRGIDVDMLTDRVINSIYVNEFELGGSEYTEALKNYIKRRYNSLKVLDTVQDGDILEIDIDMPQSFTKSLEIATDFAFADPNISLRGYYRRIYKPENFDEIQIDGIVLKINSKEHEVYDIEPLSTIEEEQEVIVRDMKGIYVVEDVSIMELTPYKDYEYDDERLRFKLIELKRYT